MVVAGFAETELALSEEEQIDCYCDDCCRKTWAIMHLVRSLPTQNAEDIRQNVCHQKEIDDERAATAVGSMTVVAF